MLLFFESGNCFSVLLLTFKEVHCLLYRFVIASWFYLDNYSFVDRQSSASGHYTTDFKKHYKKKSKRDKMQTKLACLFVCVCDLNQSTTVKCNSSGLKISDVMKCKMVNISAGLVNIPRLIVLFLNFISELCFFRVSHETHKRGLSNVCRRIALGSFCGSGYCLN